MEQIEQGALERVEAWRSSTNVGTMASPSPIVHLSFESRDQLPDSAVLVGGRDGQAVQFDGDEGVTLEDTGAFERTEPFTIAAWLRPAETGERMVVCHNSKPVWEAGRRGFELVLDPKGHVEFGLSHYWPGNALRVKTHAAISPHVWTHVAVTYDGSSRAEGIRVYLNAAATTVDILRNQLYLTTRFRRKKMPPTILGTRLSELGFRNGSVDEFQLFGHCLTAFELQRIVGTDSPVATDRSDYYIQRVDEDCAAARQRLTAARQSESDFANALRSIMVMREKAAPATAHILERGAYDRPGEEVAAGVSAAILDPGPAPPRDRLGLVEWLLRRDHPLTSRVAVNRIWSNFLGRGLVETLEDFGSQGAYPTHPELLDHLAARFMDSGWDVKRLCRLIVTSATYRQSSRPRPEITGRDPDNRLLARAPRHRLSAEEIRDAALTASGLLVRKIGGPSVKPTQPPGLWRAVGPMKFEADTGDKLYRRSLYTFWKRTVPPPSMLTFDAVSREFCVARRETTVTPAQALVLLNDPQFVEAARVLAVDVLTKHENTADAIEEIFRRLTGRRPRSEEKQELLHACAEQRQVFAPSRDAADQYIDVGQWPRDESLSSVDVATMTAVVQLVMGFLEFQVRL